MSSCIYNSNTTQGDFRFLISTTDAIGRPRNTGPWILSNNSNEVRFVNSNGLEVTSESVDGVTYVQYSQLPIPSPTSSSFSIYVNRQAYDITLNGALDSLNWYTDSSTGGATSNGDGSVTINQGIWELSLTYTTSPTFTTRDTIQTSSNNSYIGLDIITPDGSSIMSGEHKIKISSTPDDFNINSGVTTSVSDIVSIAEPTTLIVAAHSNAIEGINIQLGTVVGFPNRSTPGIVFAGNRLGDPAPT